MTASADQANPWATLDELFGVDDVATDPEQSVGELAFYGRCSTEDNQDPKTSRSWQLSNARKFVEPYGGAISTEFFDIGQSRSVPWDRRREGARLLAALKDPHRTWTAVVVGEGTRCWFGNQFSLIAPRFAAYGVDLWVPELGGKFDPRNPSHKMLMSVLGGMSESERQHVQARVRAAMDTQVVNEGRHQGGRAPYGYEVVDGGPHPNPRKAAEGHRLRVLAVDERPAEVVRRIFAEKLAGAGDRAIACGLNRDGVPCPSMRRPLTEPAPARRRVAGQHRPGDPGEPALHRLRVLRAVDTEETCFSILTMWRPDTSSDFDGSGPRRSSGPGSPRIRRSSPSMTSSGLNCFAGPEVPEGWPESRSWRGKSPSRGTICSGVACAALCASAKCRAESSGRPPITGAAPALSRPVPRRSRLIRAP